MVNVRQTGGSPADNPAAHQAALANALDNLSSQLRQLGRYRDALAAAEESITLYRPLADKSAAHRGCLARQVVPGVFSAGIGAAKRAER